MTFDEILEQVVALLKRRGEHLIERSRCALIWMTSIWLSSRKNSLTLSAWRAMRMAESWYGLAMSKRNQHQPYHLLKQHSGLIPKKPKLPRLNLRLLNQSPLTLNVASSL